MVIFVKSIIMEEWKEIPWSNGLYLASNLGNIKRVESKVKNQPSGKQNVGYRKVGGKILSQKTKKNGYMEVNLYVSPQKSKMCHVHRAVYFAFNPDADMSLQINHKNYDKSDNRLENLELVTGSENMLHANLNGRIVHKRMLGENSRVSKLNNEKVLEIRRLHSETRAVSKIAEMFSIGKTQVQRIVKRQSWSHI
jgi:hypothetical protein